MWKRISELIVCPCCHNKLEVIAIEELTVNLTEKDYSNAQRFNIAPEQLNKYIETGLILCANCKYWYPIIYGLPILLPYETPITHEFLQKHQNILNKYSNGYSTPKEIPKPGEHFVLKSFSKEWLEYTYDGVIWGWSYEDREKTFLTEMGFQYRKGSAVRYLEIGCGLGVTTHFAQKNYDADAVGVDLSLAVLKATNYYRNNPFLHFIQASLFHLPLRHNYFDLLYSHGVLHHTYSTKEAFKSASSCCKSGGLAYIWVYGKGGQTNSWDRKLGHYGELFLRPVLSKSPVFLASAILTPIALGYMLLNKYLRLTNPTLQPYNFKRALHAARDRFTPRFAHRHDYGEVEGWFKELDFNNIQRIKWQEVPSVVHSLFKGSVGVRGKRTS